MKNFEIKIDDRTRFIDIQRERDTPLMSLIINNSSTTDDHKKTFNKCRMYLRIFNISDMATGDGQYITLDSWEGRRSGNWEVQINWPRCESPSSKDWEIWRLVLCKTVY